MRHAATKALLERTRRASSSPACRASTASARRRRTSTCSSSSRRATRSSATRCCGSSSTCSTSATTTTSHRGTFRVRGDVVEVYPGLRRGARSASSSSATTVDSICRDRPAARHGRSAASTRCRSIPRATTSRPRRRSSAPSTRIRDELKERLDVLRDSAKLLEAQRLEQRTLYDLELLAEMGFCPGIENYARHLDGRAAGRAAVHAARLLSRRLPAGHRREPRHRAADRRHVPRRPLAQGDARRVRLPPAVGARQPAAPLRRVPAAHAAGALRVGDAGPLGAASGEGPGGRAAHPADRPHGPRGDRAARAPSGRRPARRDPRRGSPPASASW